MNTFDDFPSQHLGRTLESVVLEIHRETGASISTIATALLAVISLVCQGRIRITKRQGLTSPTSLWFIGVLASGELKTAIFNKLFKGVHEFSAEQRQVNQQHQQKFEGDLQTWKAAKKGVLTVIQKKATAFESIEDEQARLQELSLQKPQRPKRFKLLHERMSPQALHKNLCECYPTTSLVSDEAERVFRSQAMSDMGTLNKAFDGCDLISDRSTDGEMIAHDPCLTLALFVQPEALESFLIGKGELARSVGLLARCYVIKPPETAGFRSIAYSVTASETVLNSFHSRCKEILYSHITDDPNEMRQKVELIFAPDAQVRWNLEHDRIQAMMRPGGFFQNDKDFAAKLADKMARLAAMLHFFEGREDPISLDALERSIVISEWYAREFVKHFAKPAQIPQEHRDANNLLVWFANYLRTNGPFHIKKNELRQGGPNQLRNIVRLNAALRTLWSSNIIAEGKIENDKSAYVFLNQQYFTPTQVQILCCQPPQ